jgi:hypothetical protein
LHIINNRWGFTPFAVFLYVLVIVQFLAFARIRSKLCNNFSVGFAAGLFFVGRKQIADSIQAILT